MQVSRVLNSCTVNPYRKYSKNTAVNSRENSSGREDKVEISDNAFELYSEKQDIRADKVRDIKSRIAEGSYYVNSTDIVDKMMKSIGM